MYVNVNPANMARAIQGFVKASGGQANYSSALELVARMCGFDAYRAQKAYAETVERAGNDNVVFETVLHAWDRSDGDVSGFSDQQEARRNVPYRLRIESEGAGDQFRLCVVPDAVKDPLYSSGQNVLDVMLEINEGLPCMHFTNDTAGDMLLTVFGHAGGLLVREDEGSMDRLENANAKLEEHLKLEDWSHANRPGSCKAYAINHDTQDIWADAPVQAVAVDSDVPGKAVEQALPYRVVTSFDRASVENPQVWHFDLEVWEGADMVEWCYTAGDSTFRIDGPEQEREEFREAMVQAFSVYFNRTGLTAGLLSLQMLVKSCLAAGTRLPRRLVEVAAQHSEASPAELEKLLRMTAAVWATSQGTE